MKNTPYIKIAFAVAGLLLTVCSCTTLDTPTATTRKTVYEKEELRNRVTELENSLREINGLFQKYNTELDTIEERHKKTAFELEEKIRRLEEKISTIETERVRYQEELLKSVSTLLAERLSKTVSRELTPTTSPPQREHVVKSGETLHSIASMYGVKPDTIIRANNISNPNLLKAGQKLTIPAPAD